MRSDKNGKMNRGLQTAGEGSTPMARMKTGRDYTGLSGSLADDHMAVRFTSVTREKSVLKVLNPYFPDKDGCRVRNLYDIKRDFRGEYSQWNIKK